MTQDHVAVIATVMSDGIQARSRRREILYQMRNSALDSAVCHQEEHKRWNILLSFARSFVFLSSTMYSIANTAL